MSPTVRPIQIPEPTPHHHGSEYDCHVCPQATMWRRNYDQIPALENLMCQHLGGQSHQVLSVSSRKFSKKCSALKYQLSAPITAKQPDCDLPFLQMKEPKFASRH